MTINVKACPKCGRDTTQLEQEKRPLPIQIIEAVREADLTAEELLGLADAVGNASRGTSPRQLAEQVPHASTIITIASRAGESSWLTLLALILAAVAVYLPHMDAQQAHRDAQRAIDQAHEDAERALREGRDKAGATPRNTGELSDEDVRKIVARIEADLKLRAEP